MKQGLYANIAAKRERIKAGSGEKMRKPGTKGAPTAKAFNLFRASIKIFLEVSNISKNREFERSTASHYLSHSFRTALRARANRRPNAC